MGSWRSMRWKAFRRDRFRCQRCGKGFRFGHGLTAHHIIPRARGGKDWLANLISLCEICHDIVEINEFATLFQIKHGEDRIIPPIVIPTTDVEDWRDIDWKIRVYGGVKDFQTAVAIMVELYGEDWKPWSARI